MKQTLSACHATEEGSESGEVSSSPEVPSYHSPCSYIELYSLHVANTPFGLLRM